MVAPPAWRPTPCRQAAPSGPLCSSRYAHTHTSVLVGYYSLCAFDQKLTKILKKKTPVFLKHTKDVSVEQPGVPRNWWGHGACLLGGVLAPPHAPARGSLSPGSSGWRVSPADPAERSTVCSISGVRIPSRARTGSPGALKTAEARSPQGQMRRPGFCCRKRARPRPPGLEGQSSLAQCSTFLSSLCP